MPAKQKTSPGQTFVPKHSYAKAFGSDMRISQKSASLVCRAIKNKPLTRVKRLLEDLKAERRSLGGKYYSKAVKNMLALLNSCEKNAEFKGLDMDRLFVHASAHKGANIRRRRRKGAFGSTMKNTNMEILLIERRKAPPTKNPIKKIKKKKMEIFMIEGGKPPATKVPRKKINEQLEKKEDDIDRAISQEKEELKREMAQLKEEQKELEKDVKETEKKIENEGQK